MNDPMGKPVTVLHMFSGDLWAGAEVMIFHLLESLKGDPDLKIVALSLNEGILTSRLRNAGIETRVIDEANNSFGMILVKAFNLLKAMRIDIIHCHGYKQNLLALVLARSMGIKRLFATLHGLPEPPVQEQNGKKGMDLKTRMDYFIVNHFFTRIVAVSQEMRRVLVQRYRFRQDRIDVIHNGIPVPSSGPSPDSSTFGRFHVGTVGRMVPVKDFNLFLDVAAEIKRQTDGVRFTILGDGPLRKELIRKAAELKLADCVEFLPTRADPFPYYQSLDLFLNTSLHEGIPLTILEAMALGRPVVAPRVGGLPEIISHGEDGLLVEGREPKKFARLCLELMENKNLRMKIGDRAAKKIAAHFSSSRMAAAYLQLYVQSCVRGLSEPRISQMTNH
jgi:glycosyltransferase involved in cell wall biosynthesis